MLFSPIATNDGGLSAAGLTGYLERHFSRVIRLLLGAFVALMTAAAFGSWRTRTGYEPEWVAQALASGQGYSFDGAHRWLFDGAPPDQFFPTAWTDPLFTFLYAALIYFFGESSRLAISLFSLAFVVLAAALVAWTSKRLAGPWAGLVAMLALLLTVRGLSIQIGSAPMAGLWVALLLFYFLRHVDRLDLKRSVALGAVLGLSTLTSSSTVIFAPVMVVLILLFAPAARPAVKASAVMVLTAALLVAPWTLRNYLVFDEFVPVRTGVGQIAHAGTVALGQTFAPESTDVPVPAPWTASGPFEATARAYSVRPDRLALHDWQMKVIAAQYGPGYDRLNEAQRDERHLQEVREFMVANPLLTAQLAVPKLTRFVLSGGWPTAALTVFGIVVCSVLAFRQRLLIVPLALVAAYVAPFAVIVPYFYRYRYPIEPLIAVLVGVAVAHAAQVASRQASRASNRGGMGGRRVAATPPQQPDDRLPVEPGGALVAPRSPNAAGR